MRFLLQLTSTRPNQRISFNYQYSLSAAIYKIIERADETYANFLHEDGYGTGGKSFKFFTFSDIRTPFTNDGDCMQMTTNNAFLTICFHIPGAAESFIKGVFLNQQIDIADSVAKATFTIQQVIAEKMPVISDNKEIELHLSSPIVVGRHNERGNYDYLSPEDADFASLLITNLISKYAACYNAEEQELQALKSLITIRPIYFRHPPKSRLIAIKKGTPAASGIRGFYKFRLLIKGPEKLIALALNAGLGMHNSQGMGCVEIV